MAANLPLWMGSVPDYEVVNGNMQITVGEFSLAMPINVFLVGCAKGTAEITKWERHRNASADIIKIDFDSKFERRLRKGEETA